MRSGLLVGMLAVAAMVASPAGYQSAKEKMDRIATDSLRPGSQVQFTDGELNAYAEHEIPSVTDGVRNPRLEFLGSGLARGSALIDFARVRRSQGHPPGWLLSKLLEGERPVTVTARIRSASGRATVDVQKVEISGIGIDGATLDFLIQHFLLAIYPTAVVGQPFELSHRIDRIDVQPGTAKVTIGR